MRQLAEAWAVPISTSRRTILDGYLNSHHNSECRNVLHKEVERELYNRIIQLAKCYFPQTRKKSEIWHVAVLRLTI